MTKSEALDNSLQAKQMLHDIFFRDWTHFDEKYEEFIFSYNPDIKLHTSLPQNNPVYLAATYIETRLRMKDRFLELIGILQPWLNPDWSVTKRLEALIPVYNQTDFSGFPGCFSNMVDKLADSISTPDLVFSQEQKQLMALNIFAESVAFTFRNLRNIGHEALFSNKILPQVLLKISDHTNSDRLGMLTEYLSLCSSPSDLNHYNYPWKQIFGKL